MAVDFVAVSLVLFYGAILATGLQQLHTAYNSRNKVYSIRNAIVTILTFSAFLRVGFWIKTCSPGYVNDTLMMIVFFLPLWLNFCGLSLLAVFYAEAVYGGKSKWPMRFCVLGNAILLALNVTISTGLAKVVEDDDAKEVTSQAEAFSIIYSSTMDFILAVLLFYYGYQFQSICNESGNALTTWTNNSVSIFESINWMLITIYIFRGVVGGIISTHPNVMGQVRYNGTHEPTKGSVCIFFFVAEVLPSLCVIMMLWRITGTGIARNELVGEGTTNNTNTGLYARLLSVEDSKVRILVGNESMQADDDNDTVDTSTADSANIFGEDNNGSSYLLFSSGDAPESPDKRAARIAGTGVSSSQQQQQQQQGQHDDQQQSSLEDDAASAGAGAAAEAAAVTVATNVEEGIGNGDSSTIVGGSVPSNAPIDISNYSISAESSFLNDNKDMFQMGAGIGLSGSGSIGSGDSVSGGNAAAAAAIDIINSRSSPMIIAPKDGNMSSGGALSFGRRGSWNSRANFVSKRTPSPMLLEQRLSDADQDNPMLIGSVPNSSSSSSGSGGNGGVTGAPGLRRHGSTNDLPVAATPTQSAIPEHMDDSNGSGTVHDPRSPQEKYSDTISPRDILLQAERTEGAKRSGKGHGSKHKRGKR